MNDRRYWIYILASKPYGTLYIGVTNSLVRRIWQHKQRNGDSFTARYGVDRLVHVEPFRDITNAIAREKTLKGWRRDRKIELIIRDNPTWRDLSDGWYGDLEGTMHHVQDDTFRSPRLPVPVKRSPAKVALDSSLRSE